MFLIYQDHVAQMADAGQQTDANFQVNLMTDLENETQTIFGTVPVIIEIYRAEALASNGQQKEYADLIAKSLQQFPDSIPFKVYQYMETKDSKLREDLLKNHPKHWMVIRFEIK